MGSSVCVGIEWSFILSIFFIEISLGIMMRVWANMGSSVCGGIEWSFILLSFLWAMRSSSGY